MFQLGLLNQFCKKLQSISSLKMRELCLYDQTEKFHENFLLMMYDAPIPPTSSLFSDKIKKSQVIVL